MVTPSILKRLNFSIIGSSRRFIGGFLDPYQRPANTTFCAFIRTSGGRFRITKYTGQRSAGEDLNKEIPSVDSINPRFCEFE